jgi:hypothetical protein
MLLPGDNVTEQDILSMCEAVDAGELSVELEGGETWDVAYSGNMSFRFGNGFRILVFNDCGEWDYIDSYIAADGTRTEVNVPDVTETVAEDLSLFDWEPKHFARWGITTGYLNVPLPADQL